MYSSLFSFSPFFSLCGDEIFGSHLHHDVVDGGGGGVGGKWRFEIPH